MATTTHPRARRRSTGAPDRSDRPYRGGRRDRRQRPNYVAGLMALVWLAFIAVPLWVMISWSLDRRDNVSSRGPVSLPGSVTTENVRTVFDSGYFSLFANTAVVTLACVGLTLVVAVPAAYAVVRSPSRWVATVFRAFLLGLALPAQATIIPVYLLIVRMRLYDTLLAIILPTVAFGLPLATLVLVSALRDVPRDMYEAMTLDGAGAFRMMLRLVLPMSWGGIATVGIYAGLNAWNGFLFPLILTQSPERRVLTLGLFNFQTQFGVNIPALMTAVLLSAVPIFVAYLFARRWLVAGLAGVGGR